MNRAGFRFLYAGLVVLAAMPVFAQGGCTNSPENPTAILGLVGAAGLFYSPIKGKLISLWRKK